MLRVQNFLRTCVISLVLVVSACGAGSREFTASQLVGELNDNGAPLQLEGPLHSEQESVEVYELSISTLDPPTAGGHAESGATVIIADDEGIATTEFERCESAVSLICFRIANGVLILSDDEPATLSKIEAAVQAMESE